MGKKGIRWSKLLRRGAALFMATMALWVLGITAGAGGGTAALERLGQDGRVVSALLQTELGRVPEPQSSAAPLGIWGRLALGQSALLGKNAEAAWAAPADRPDPPAAEHPAPPAAPADPDDPHHLPATPLPAGQIVPRTLVPTSTEGYAFANGVYIFNRTKLPLDAAALAAAPVELKLGDPSAPQVLIMHTHATEAYTPDGTDTYVQTDTNRTLDCQQNVVRVGNEIKAVFEELGLSVLHDETPYDYPAYQGSYSRSQAGVQAYLTQYPSIKIVLDVHRDALIGADGTVYKAVTTLDGSNAAQVMLVLGSPEGGDHPLWLQNLTLAMKLQRSMNSLYPTLARPITIRSSVYNQNLTPGSLLVEVGCHGNTLQEAIIGGRLFARAAGQVLLGLAPQ
ncbi:MAG: stage II sporulation protein P [Pseudoflavonifractor sp.]